MPNCVRMGCWCIISYRMLVLVRCIDTICLQFKILQCVNINQLQIRRNHMPMRAADCPLSDQSNTALNISKTNGGKIERFCVPIQIAMLSTLSNLRFNRNISAFLLTSSNQSILRGCPLSPYRIQFRLLI